jgi:phosphate transport system permease protein
MVALIPLISILFEVVQNGYLKLSIEFLTGRVGGMTGIGNAILGTLLLVGYASAMAIPTGILTGVYVSEFGYNKMGKTIRFFNDVMANFPSIVIGLLVYSFVVLYLNVGYSLIAGAVALAIIMIPIVANTTEEALKMVPNSLREGSLALGVSRWRTVLKVVLSNGRSGVVTGTLLSISRAAGETAPLILTALFSLWWSTSPTDEIASLPTLIWNYAMGFGSGNISEQRAQAWGAALVLIIIVLSINISARIITRNRYSSSKGAMREWIRRLRHKS